MFDGREVRNSNPGVLLGGSACVKLDLSCGLLLSRIRHVDPVSLPCCWVLSPVDSFCNSLPF